MTALRTPFLVVACAAGVAGVAASSACVDEEHQLQVGALGGEDPNVPRGPLHRPGQPCLVCHGGEGPAKLQMSVAGTVYVTQGQTQPADGAQIQIEDATGSNWHVTTNSAGNFFVLPSDWSPTYPITVPTLLDGTGMMHQGMTTNDNRDGSCATCHTPNAGPDSPGPVYLNPAPVDGGGP